MAVEGTWKHFSGNLDPELPTKEEIADAFIAYRRYFREGKWDGAGAAIARALVLANTYLDEVDTPHEDPDTPSHPCVRVDGTDLLGPDSTRD